MHMNGRLKSLTLRVLSGCSHHHPPANFHKTRLIVKADAMCCGNLPAMAIALTVIAGSALPVQAAIIARFDVGGDNSNGASHPLQSGWADLNPTNMTATQNDVTLTIGDTSPESRDRTSTVIAGNPLENVLRDFLFTRSTDGAVTVIFSGLVPDTDYEITTYAFDSSGGSNETGFWYLGSVAPENLQHSWLSSPSTLDEGEDIFMLTGTSDESGTLTYLVTTDNTSRINGFEVNQVPESSALVLVSLAGLMVIRRRR